ncbi:MAG TPA: hypothetical protein VFB38_17995 [Chthonomonadaceae bacterium]|nr:hypothetical protein [Chthonomonadaceae bacterium]
MQALQQTVHAIRMYFHYLALALQDSPDKAHSLTDTDIPLSMNQQEEASSLSVALYQMGLIKRLPETPPTNPYPDRRE